MIFAQKQPSSGASGSSSCKNVYHVPRSHSVLKCFYHLMFKEGDCYMSSCTTKFLHNTSPSVEWKNKYIQINNIQEHMMHTILLCRNFVVQEDI